MTSCLRRSHNKLAEEEIPVVFVRCLCLELQALVRFWCSVRHVPRYVRTHLPPPTSAQTPWIQRWADYIASPRAGKWCTFSRTYTSLCDVYDLRNVAAVSGGPGICTCVVDMCCEERHCGCICKCIATSIPTTVSCGCLR